jgi:hypothetical protein
MGDMEEEDNSTGCAIGRFLRQSASFYGTVRFLDGTDAATISLQPNLRNTGLALQILRDVHGSSVHGLQSLVMNIDLSGNILRNFLEPVPVVPTAPR